MPSTIDALRWAVGIPYIETPFGTQILDANLTSWIEIASADFAKIEKTFRTDRNQINGTRGATRYQLETAMGTIARKFDLSVEVFTWLLAMGLGNLSTSGAGDPWTHTIKHPSVCTLYPKSFSLIEGLVCAGLTATQKLYKGCTVEQLTITVNGKGAIEFGATIKHDGTETAKAAFTFPTSILPVTYLIGSQTTIKLNQFDQADADISAQLQSLKITVNFGTTPTKAVTNGVFVQKYKYTKDHPNIDVELVISADKSDPVYVLWANNTKVKLQVTLDAGVSPLRTINLSIAEAYINSCEQDSDDSEPTLTVKLDELDLITNSGPAVWVCKTGVAAYLTNGS
jgi:hypothetical protein